MSLQRLTPRRALLAAAALLLLLTGVWALGAPARERLALGRSFGVASLAALVSLVCGVPYALLLERWSRWPRAALTLLGMTPLVIPPYVAAIAWVDTFGPAGLVPRLLGARDPTGPSLLASGWVYSAPSCGVLLGAAFFPLVFLATRAALRRVPREALEAAELARGPGGRRRLLLTSVAPHALAGAACVFALAAVEFATPLLLRVGVLVEEVYLRFDADAQAGSALRAALPLVALTLAGAAAAAAWWRPAALPADAHPPERSQPWRARAGALAFALLVLTPGLWLPGLSLGVRLTHDPTATLPGAPAEPGGPWERARTVIGAAVEVGAEDALNSARVGAWTATLGVLLAWLLVEALQRAGPLVVGASALPGVLLALCPPPLIGIALLVGLNREGLAALLDRLAVVGLACGARFEGLVFLLILAGARRIPVAQREAARLAGRLPALGVALPQLLPSLSAGWALLYLLTVSEYAASSLVYPPGRSLLAVFLVNEAHYGQGAELSGLVVLLLVTALLPLLALAPLGAWLERRAR